MSKLLYIVKFCPKNQSYATEATRYFYNKKKAEKVLYDYIDHEFSFATLYTIQPEE